MSERVSTPTACSPRNALGPWIQITQIFRNGITTSGVVEFLLYIFPGIQPDGGGFTGERYRYCNSNTAFPDTSLRHTHLRSDLWWTLFWSLHTSSYQCSVAIGRACQWHRQAPCFFKLFVTCEVSDFYFSPACNQQKTNKHVVVVGKLNFLLTFEFVHTVWGTHVTLLKEVVKMTFVLCPNRFAETT